MLTEGAISRAHPTCNTPRRPTATSPNPCIERAATNPRIETYSRIPLPIDQLRLYGKREPASSRREGSSHGPVVPGAGRG